MKIIIAILIFSLIIIFHELVQQNPVSVSGGSGDQPHSCRCLSFSISIINMNQTCFVNHLFIPFLK